MLCETPPRQSSSYATPQTAERERRIVSKRSIKHDLLPRSLAGSILAYTWSVGHLDCSLPSLAYSHVFVARLLLAFRTLLSQGDLGVLPLGNPQKPKNGSAG